MTLHFFKGGYTSKTFLIHSVIYAAVAHPISAYQGNTFTVNQFFTLKIEITVFFKKDNLNLNLSLAY